MKRVVLIGVLLHLCLIKQGHAAVFLFANGDRLNAQVIEETKETYTVKSNTLGQVQIKKASVAEVILDKNDVIQAKTVTAPTVAEQSKDILGGKLPFPEAWKYEGMINLGFQKSDGNQSKTSLNTDSVVKIQSGKNRFTAKADVYLEEDEGSQIENERLFGLEYDRYLTDQLFFNSNAQYEVDKDINLEERQTFGVGIGYDFIKQDLTSLTATAGINTVSEEFTSGAEEEFESGRWSADFSHKFFEKKGEFFHNQTGLFSLEDSENIDFKTKTGVRWALYENWKLSTQVNFDWDNQPAAGAREEDIKYLMSLGYSFGDK